MIIFITVRGKCEVKLYHGTIYSSAMNIIENGIDLVHSQKLLDFGQGFYTTPDKEHANKTARNKALRYNKKYKKTELPVIMVFDYIENEKLRIKTFDTHNTEWMKFVLANRMNRELIKKYHITEHNMNQKYDIVKGEIADGHITQIAAQIRNKELEYSSISVKELLVDKGNSYGYQISFHTPEALDCIKYRKCDILFK